MKFVLTTALLIAISSTDVAEASLRGRAQPTRSTYRQKDEGSRHKTRAEINYVSNLNSEDGPLLNECEGDCDNDDDCAGDLVCFQRDDEPVPGCSGNPGKKHDYCINPDLLPKTPESLPEINYVSNLNSADGPLLNECEGDCDDDEDCEGNLVCFQRDNEEVPGCSGNPGKKHDYCINPDLLPKTRAGIDYVSNLNSEDGPLLNQCEGDCDNDDDCVGDLVCFQRDDDEPVPGCSGNPGKKHDYCISPDYHPLRYVGNNGSPAAKYPLGRCEGECDSDEDCKGNLVCFQRDGNVAVPGCVGKPGIDHDYCIDPTDVIEGTIFDPTDANDEKIVTEKKDSFPEVIGMSGDDAKEKLEFDYPGIEIQIIPYGAFVTEDYRENRIRIRVDESGFVNEVPRIG